MILASLNFGGAEILIIVLVLFFMIALGNYGKNAIFGYWGSVLLAIFTTPLIAFIILAYVKAKTAKQSN